LAAHYGGTYRSAQSAVEHLEQLGLVERIQGSGTYVTGSEDTAAHVQATTDQVHLIFGGQPAFVAPLIQPIMARLQAVGMVPVPIFHEERQGQTPHRLEHILRQWDSQPPRAIILKSGDLRLDRLIRQHCPARTRIVSAYSTVNAVNQHWNSVTVDEFQMYGLAAQYLLRRGHRRLGLVIARRDSTDQGTTLARLRHAPIRGMLHACRQAGLERGLAVHPNPKTAFDPDGLGTDPATLEQLAAWLRDKRPTAMVGSPVRLSCLQVAADRAGWRFGWDFDVVGVGESMPAQRGDYVCIAEPYDQVARHIVDLIETEQDAVHRIVVPPRFVPRCVHRDVSMTPEIFTSSHDQRVPIHVHDGTEGT
jgi:DNA-binding LacI/PurR family transcriptional regulator